MGKSSPKSEAVNRGKQWLSLLDVPYIEGTLMI